MAEFEAGDATRYPMDSPAGRLAEAMAQLGAGEADWLDVRGADLGAYGLTLGHDGGDHGRDSATDEQQNDNDWDGDNPPTGGVRL